MEGYLFAEGFDSEAARKELEAHRQGDFDFPGKIQDHL